MKIGRVALAVILLELFIASLALYHYGFSVPGLQAVTRFSGRLSLIIFSIIFLFRNNTGNIDTLLLVKPYHVFALAHGIHLVELLFYVYVAGLYLVPIRIAGGFIAYLFIFIMPFVYDQYIDGKVSLKKFSIVERIFLYYTWLIFFMTYLPRVRETISDVGGNYWEHVALLGWVSLMMGMKITRLLVFEPRRPQ